jgi:hypothetical protein
MYNDRLVATQFMYGLQVRPHLVSAIALADVDHFSRVDVIGIYVVECPDDSCLRTCRRMRSFYEPFRIGIDTT